MVELTDVQIPKSINTLETLVTRCSLMCLTQAVHVFDKIKRERKITIDEFESIKRFEPSIRELEALVNEKTDRKRNFSVSLFNRLYYAFINSKKRSNFRDIY